MFSSFFNLISPFTFGQVLVVSGEAKKDCKNFRLKFCNDEDFPLAIFVNFKTLEIVINSFLNNKWYEDSIKISIESFPVSRFFTFYILASEKQFHIAYNDQHICHYQFLPNIKTIKISGELKSIQQVDHRNIFPIPWPPIQEVTRWTPYFTHDIPQEFIPGCVIVFTMKISGNSNGKFHIRFCDRSTKKQLFHFSIRLDEKVVIANSMSDAFEWMKETRIKECPVKLDKEFSIAIGMTTSAFKVAINGRHFITYEYRMIQIPKSSFNGHNQIFEKLTGPKIFGENGLQIQVLSVDHTLLKEECEMYEVLSNSKFIGKK